MPYSYVKSQISSVGECFQANEAALQDLILYMGLTRLLISVQNLSSKSMEGELFPLGLS